MKKDIANLILVFVILQVLFHFLLPIKIIYAPYNYIGIFLIVIGFLPNLWIGIKFRKINTALWPHETPSKLITTGMFKFSRNPNYLGMVVMLVGIAVFLGSLIPFVVPIVFFILINKFNVAVEEKILKKKFGKKYLNYQKKVRRWL